MFSSDVLSRHRIIVVSAIAISGAFVSIFLYNRTNREQETQIQAEFQHRAERNAHIVRGSLTVYPEMMAQLATIGSFRNRVYWAMLERSFEQIVERHPTIAIMQWVPMVGDPDREDFENGNSRINGRAFNIRQRQENGSFIPAPRSDFYYPIQLAVPLQGHESVIGYDLSSAPTWESLQTARTSNRLVATPQYTLAQENAPDDLLAVNLITPVFMREKDAESGSFRGYIQCVLRIHETLALLHRNSVDEALLIYYEDASAAEGERALLYANLAGHEPPLSNTQTAKLPEVPDGPSTGLHVATIPIGGRQWRVLTQINPIWAAAQRTRSPSLILGGGLIVTLLLSLLVNTMMLRNRKIERTVKSRTQALEKTRKMLERDITRRVVTEKKWRESESLLRGVLENSVSEIFVKDRGGRYILFNEEYTKAIGKTTTEIFGHTDREMFSAEIAETFLKSDRQVLETREMVRFELETEFMGRHRVDLVQKFPIFDGEGEIHAMGGIVTEITDLVKAERLRQDYERKLQASQKMESLGVLAGGIAHDFNNILATVLGQASLLRRSGKLTGPQDHQVGLIEVAARRASELCEQMLTYAGKASHVTELVDANQIVRETSELLIASLPKNIPITTELAPALSQIRANPTQMRQLVMNLIINAADAIEPESGKITVRTESRHFETNTFPPNLSPTQLAPGDYTVITFTDTGPGIEPSILERIFEPFFSTKFQGRGLGLSTVLGIVQNTDGGVAVTSDPNTGTVFTLLFPAEPEALLPSPISPIAAQPTEIWGGALIVDDEEQLRELAATLLESEGMTVFSAANGEDAIELFKKHQSEIHVILLDLIMPGISGTETLVELRKINPDLRVIMLSGYSADDPKTHLAGITFDAFLQKPYEIGELLDEISAVLPPR